MSEAKASNPADLVLRLIESAAESAIKAAHAQRDVSRSEGGPQRWFEHAAINWGDLGVVEVVWCRSLTRTWYCVLIEEAAPDNWEFQKFVADELAAGGWPDVEVRTEW